MISMVDCLETRPEVVSYGDEKGYITPVTAGREGQISHSSGQGDRLQAKSHASSCSLRLE
jgi:hypothetical protein